MSILRLLVTFFVLIFLYPLTLWGCHPAIEYCNILDLLNYQLNFSKVSELTKTTLEAMNVNRNKRLSGAYLDEFAPYLSVIKNGISSDIRELLKNKITSKTTPDERWSISDQEYEDLPIWDSPEFRSLSREKLSQLKDLFRDWYFLEMISICQGFFAKNSRITSNYENGKCKIKNQVLIGDKTAPSYLAYKKAGIRSTDSREEMINKAIKLMRGLYFVRKTIDAIRPSKRTLDDQLKMDLSKNRFQDDYYFDAYRTTEEVLNDGIGGGCTSYQKGILGVLLQAGIPPEDIKLVRVVNPDLVKRVCPKSGRSIDRSLFKNLITHTLLMINVGNQTTPDWRLYDQAMEGIQGYSIDKEELIKAQQKDQLFIAPELKHFSNIKIHHTTGDFMIKDGVIFNVINYDGCMNSRTDTVNIIASGNYDSNLCR